MKNSCKSWTPEELSELDSMVRDGISMRTISKTLGRTENAVRNAFRNIVYHQLLDHDAATVAEQYNMTVYALYNDIVHPKYDVSAYAESPSYRMVYVGLATLLTVGSAMYAHLVMNNWHV